MSNLLTNLQSNNGHPAVVCTITSAGDLSALPDIMAHSSKPDLLELRLDLLGSLADQAVQAVSALKPKPDLLLTARRGDEGGGGNLSCADRQRLFNLHLARAALIDIEIRSLETENWGNFIALVRSQASPPLIIGSYHDFKQTPAHDSLKAVISRGMAAGVDIVKIATRLQSENDLQRLKTLLDSPPLPLAVMGMGEHLGQISRIQLARAGSLLNYGYAVEESAPGQWQANSLARQLRKPNK